jgi:hypothetical protein
MLVWVIVLILPACGGPAVCGPFDEPCRAAARVAQRVTGIEPRAVRNDACGEGVRCFWFSFPNHDDVGVSHQPDGRLVLISR